MEATRNRSKSMLESGKGMGPKLVMKKKDSLDKNEKEGLRERPTFKERVSVSMRHTIRQRKDSCISKFSNLND